MERENDTYETFPDIFILRREVRKLSLVNYYNRIMSSINAEKIVDNCCAQLLYHLKNKHTMEYKHLHGVLATTLSLCLKFHTTRKDHQNLEKKLGMKDNDLRNTESYILGLFKFDIPFKIPNIITMKQRTWSEVVKNKKINVIENMSEDQHENLLKEWLKDYRNSNKKYELLSPRKKRFKKLFSICSYRKDT